MVLWGRGASTIWTHMCIVISENLTETYLIVVISILFSGKPFIRCFQNHCNTLALNAYPLAGSHLSSPLERLLLQHPDK